MRSTKKQAISRRGFLKGASAGAISVASAIHINGGEPEPIPALDAHTHFYDPNRPQGVPWPGKQDQRLYRTVLPGEFKELTKKHHVRSTIVVEASPWLEDNQWLLDLARKEPFLVGVVGRLDPAQNDFEKNFNRFARDPLFRGIRVNHADLRRGLEQKAYLANLNLLVKHDRELDVNGGPDELRIVINHAANVRIDGKAPPVEWRNGMRAAAAGKLVFCKVSALVEGTRRKRGDVPGNVDFYRQILDALWDLYGENRLIYGSNWPVSENAAPYAMVHEIVRGYFQKRGALVAEKFFLRNAVAAYKPVNRSPK